MVESYHTKHTERSHSRTRSYVSHDQETRKLQQEIDRLRRKLRHREHDRRSPSFPPSDGSRGSRDLSYRRRSRTPSSESYSASLRQDRLEKCSNKREKRSSHHGMENDAMSKALQQISKSPFIRRINKAKLPHRFSRPTFTIYNGGLVLWSTSATLIKKMAVHANNEALMCKVLPSSLGPVAMRWFDTLEEGLVGSFKELTRAFETRFITCSRVPKPVDSLLSMAMREGQTLKTYSDRYLETYNKTNRDFEDVAVRTFKVGLPTKH